MSAQDVRNEIIRENIPKLLRALTGVQDDDENMRRWTQFAWSIVRNHRNMSTNSHEVRRKIEGIQEKFNVENFPEFASHLGRLCDEIAQHPLCLQHYEVDVHWSLLDLLLSLAYNPAGALRRNKDKIDHRLQAARQSDLQMVQSDEEYLKTILKEVALPVMTLNDSSSDLSDWSDNPDDVLIHSDRDSQNLSNKQIVRVENSPFTSLTNIRPPERQLPFKLFDGSRSMEHLMDTVQSGWWQPDALDEIPHSERMEANFATMYIKHVNDMSNNVNQFIKPCLISEMSLLRELVWMFNKPVSCKFFEVEGNDIKVRPHVTVPSLTTNGLKNFLELHLIPPIKMMNTLRQFNESIYKCEDFTPSKTMETYAASLSRLLAPIWNQLVEYEKRLIDQRNFEINTIIHFHGGMLGTFDLLGRIYALHQQVVLDRHKLPEHIVTVYLLTRLMQSELLATTATQSNLAASLFLTSVKVFCVIIDMWWTEGRLEDYQKEFLVERVSATDNNVCARLFENNKEKSLFVPEAVTKGIVENDFFCLLLEHTLEVGSTLNWLYEIHRIGDLRKANKAIEDQLYDVFLNDVMQQVRLYQSQLPAVPPEESGNANQTSDVIDATTKSSSGDHDLLSSLSTNDEFLRLAFANSSFMRDGIRSKRAVLPDYSDWDALTLFEQFQQTRHKLPFQEIILSSLTRIFQKRIAIANSFVMQVYRDEYKLFTHLHTLRIVLLLESSDLMQHFYNEVFLQIESGRLWAKSVQLTTLLNNVICPKYPHMLSLFQVEMDDTLLHSSGRRKVVESVDGLIVKYNVSRELAHIITPDTIAKYNKLFRFLLKIKWALCTLEHLRFPRSSKGHFSYVTNRMNNVLMHRLQQLRFWMFYAIQTIHSHLMMHVLHSMRVQLDEKIANCKSIKELEAAYKSYISTIVSQCFLVEEFKPIQVGIEQLLDLMYIMRDEWNNSVELIEQDHPLSLASSDTDSDNEDIGMSHMAHDKVNELEVAYIRCHQFLAKKLRNEHYVNKHTFLAGLSSALNSSMPY